jgi:hypothetical protein
VYHIDVDDMPSRSWKSHNRPLAKKRVEKNVQTVTKNQRFAVCIETPEGVAQSVEQRTFNPLVLGSSPSALTLDFQRDLRGFRDLPSVGRALFRWPNFGCIPKTQS